MNTRHYRLFLYSVAGALVVLNGIFAFILVSSGNEVVHLPEIEELAGKDWSLQEYAVYFTRLAEERGADYAYQVLKKAPIAPGVDMHLLGHVVSDEIYRQYGIEGIRFCDHDFRNACSHSIVIGALLEKGPAATEEIREACHQASGGRGAYAMCFHGLGHGVLAYTDYDLERAVEICALMGTEEYGQREHIECVGGAIMEIIGGGFHDRELWAQQSDRYLSAEDPLSPCNKPFIEDHAKPVCYTYLTPHLLRVVGASLSAPTAQDFENAFPLCGLIPEGEEANRGSCYGGFGKEFVVFAKERDIRSGVEIGDDALKKVYEWCALADREEGVDRCMYAAVGSLYWGGENDPDAALRFCSMIPHERRQRACMETLIGYVSYYERNRDRREQFCGIVPSEYGQACRDELVP